MPRKSGIELQFRNKRYSDVRAGTAAVMKGFNETWDGSPKVLSDEMKDLLDKVIETLSARHGTGFPGGTSENSLSKRSGLLIRALQKSVKVRGKTIDTIEAEIVIPASRSIHETGGTIRPKNKKFLTIPLPDAQNSRGIAPPFARQWKNTFVAETKKGNLIIFQRRATKIVPLYLLKKSVTIKPRLGLRTELMKSIPYFKERLADRLAAEVQRAQGA